MLDVFESGCEVTLKFMLGAYDMASHMNTQGIIDKVTQMAESLAEEQGLSVWDVTYKKEGSEYYLRVYIDKESGVSIDDCVDFTHVLSDALDADDFIDSSYIFEVSSPGIERKLIKEEHFKQYIGSPVIFKTIKPIDNEHKFNGILRGYENGIISIEVEGKGILSINRKETSFVKLDDFDMSDFDKEV